MKLVIKSKSINDRQGGFTLIELMVSMLIGLIILAAVITMFVTMIKSDSDNLKTIRLNQELRAAMGLMIRDIRRSGANRNAAVNSATMPPTNPFSTISIPINTTATSISFSYDAVADASTELYGYRRNSTAGTERVETCRGTVAAGCGAWQPVTDESLVNITNLSFTDVTVCFPAPVPPATCVTNPGINIREITVTLSGQLRRDAAVARTLTETIKVRNDEI